MSELLSSITAFIMNYYDTALAVVGAFALLASKTPNKTDDRIVQGMLDLVNFVGANFGTAKNKGD